MALRGVPEVLFSSFACFSFLAAGERRGSWEASWRLWAKPRGSSCGKKRSGGGGRRRRVSWGSVSWGELVCVCVCLHICREEGSKIWEDQQLRMLLPAVPGLAVKVTRMTLGAEGMGTLWKQQERKVLLVHTWKCLLKASNWPLSRCVLDLNLAVSKITLVPCFLLLSSVCCRALTSSRLA